MRIRLAGVLIALVRVAMIVTLIPVCMSCGICLIVPAVWIANVIGLGDLAYFIELAGLLLALGAGVLPFFIDQWLWSKSEPPCNRLAQRLRN